MKTLPLLLALALGGEAEFTHDSLHKTGKYRLELPGDKAASKAGASKSEPWLLVFFHGAGGGGSYDAFLPELKSAATGRNVAVMAVQAPNHSNSWADAFDGPSRRHAAYIADLLKRKVYSEHRQLSPKRTVFIGMSAGATFIGGDLLPDHIKDYQGGAILLCGGAPPRSMSDAAAFQKLSDATAKSFKIYFSINVGDFLAEQAYAGSQYWEWRGLKMKIKDFPGNGHCAFDMKKAVEEGLDYIGVPKG
ncbi:MAG: alpha/beta fold hydrolase [Deltaproteobacteria bacterium]|nr:alpha/beta fold hydrolase [Deltaproteobacteria bacterium]